LGGLAAGIYAKIASAILCLIAAIWFLLWYFIPAPPSVVSIAAGNKGGSFGWTIAASEASRLFEVGDILLVDLREAGERAKHGVIPGSIHAPYADLANSLQPGGMLHQLARTTGSQIMFYCASGERSAMAVQTAQDAGLTSPVYPRRAQRMEKFGGSTTRE
jgi:rhodanese-related sulfurtransferase